MAGQVALAGPVPHGGCEEQLSGWAVVDILRQNPGMLHAPLTEA